MNQLHDICQDDALRERQAQDMLDAFASVGVARFTLMVRGPRRGRQQIQPDMDARWLRPLLGRVLQNAAESRRNVFVRPLSVRPWLIQLYGLGEARMQRVKPAAFFISCIRPGRYDAWLAVADGGHKLTLRLWAELAPVLNNLDRAPVSGSIDFDPRHKPHFPAVQTVHVAPGLVLTSAQLAALGLLGKVE